MRSAGRSNKSAAAAVLDRRPRWLQSLGWSYKEAAASVIAAGAVVAILVNSLWMQTGAHPAPMFKGQPLTANPLPTLATTVASVAPVQAMDTTAATPVATVKVEAQAARPGGEIIADIQRELARRGLYDGAIDGRYGPRTDAAVRDFEQGAGLKPSAEPGEALLAAIKRAPLKTVRTPPATSGSSGRVAAQPVRLDPIGEMLGPSKRVVAVQRALAEYGYGQLKPTGIIDNETRAAVEKFERERKLPITGQVSDRVIRELAAITGRPLE